MEGKLIDSAATGTSENFEPTSKWVREEDSDTALLFLPGFKKEQLRVQLTTGTLKISGKRPLGDDKWSSFYKEFPVSSNCDIKGITAKFENSVLYVKQPKLITPLHKKQDQTDPHVTSSHPTKPAPNEQPKPLPEAKAQEPTPSMAAAHGKANENPPREAVEAKHATAKSGELTDDAKRAPEKKTDDGASASEKAPPAKKESEKPESILARVVHDDGCKAKFEDYKKAVGGLAMRVRSSKKAMNWVVLSLMAIVLGIYVKNWFGVGKKDHN